MFEDNEVQLRSTAPMWGIPPMPTNLTAVRPNKVTFVRQITLHKQSQEVLERAIVRLSGSVDLIKLYFKGSDKSGACYKKLRNDISANRAP